ncbi:DUF2207 domain-containing protein [Bradyrhizobium prioriisuperbiae]|uniref:DUF2207 domain-containing protein n=1 Tax=Bradyrhizobium prioriisuperbiae TaxID=2854389 RepID=UPI0028E6C1DB|nr:DUF2207 domain-containing protein [Bradyrhizobium prioritasuperba]
MRYLQRAGLAVVVLASLIVPASANERITRFVSDVDVQHDGDLLVTETIAVQAEGNVIKRGILRDFPTSYTNRNGTHVEVAFDVQSVTRDGASERYATERLTNGVRVRIGSADKILDRGPHEFVIKYRTSRQVGFFADFDELYWNATGNGWTFPIDAAEARIRLPEAVPFRQSAFYTGPQGAKDKNAYVFEQRPGLIVFRTTQALPPNQGLTVAAGWQKGVIEPPSQSRLLGLWLQDNLPLAAAGLGLLLILGYYLSAWRRVGHDPQGGTIIPLFGPPKGMSPAAVRYVSQMGMDDKAFTAAIVGLGVQGHLKLAERKNGLQMVPRTGGKLLNPDEQAVAKSLFGKRSSPLDLDQSNCKILQRAQTALTESLAKAYADRMFHDNKSWSVRGLQASLAVIVAVLISVFAGWGNDRGVTTVIGMLSFLPALIVLTLLLTAGRPHSIGMFALLAFGCLFSAIVGVNGYQIVTDNHHGWAQALPAALPLVLVPLASSAFTWMKAHTVEGRQITDQIEGFRQYLGVAEEDRLNALNPPEKTPELFERFLPYAIALDVENAWARRFADVLAAASVAAVASSWYSNSSSSYDRTSDPAGFATYLGNSLSQTISSASTPPGSSGSSSSSSDSSSSGSGGGGSSGDGGGGGGGSGW